MTRKFSEQELARGREVPALDPNAVLRYLTALKPIGPPFDEDLARIAASFILPPHLIPKEPRSITATEVLARLEEQTSPEARKRRTPFNERFYIERAGDRVIARWYDGDFMFNGEYLDTIGMDGV